MIDGIAAFDWLAARSGNEIVVLGQSLGSGVAVDTAGQRPAVAVILVSAYLSVLSLAQTYYPFFPVALLTKDPFRSDLKIAGVRQPKLFIHGRHDTIIPLSSGEALYQIAPEPKQMLIYDAGHNDLWDARMAKPPITRAEQRRQTAPPTVPSRSASCGSPLARISRSGLFFALHTHPNRNFSGTRAWRRASAGPEKTTGLPSRM